MKDTTKIPVISKVEDEPVAKEEKYEKAAADEKDEEESVVERISKVNDLNKEELLEKTNSDIPVVVRTGNYQKEQIFVSKGQVISHYEDDMDVPTFLRKQMQ